MPSRWSAAGPIATILLGLGICLLWAWSFFYFDAVRYGYRGASFHFVFVNSNDGSLSIGLETIIRMPPAARTGLGLSHLRSRSGYPWTRSLLEFQLQDRTVTIPGFGTFSMKSITAPTWILVIPWALIAQRVFLSHGNRVRWQFRKEVSRFNPRLRWRIGRFAMFSVVGCVLGALVAWLDKEIGLSRTNGLWTVVLLMLLPVVSLMAVYTRRRIPWHRAILWMSLELAGCVVFFESTIYRLWRYEHLHTFDDLELLQTIILVGIFCFIFGAILLLFLQVKPEPVKPGPYCPECGYCLIGSPRPICSECGRPFTLDELGIAAEGLVPPSLS